MSDCDKCSETRKLIESISSRLSALETRFQFQYEAHIDMMGLVQELSEQIDDVQVFLEESDEE